MKNSKPKRKPNTIKVGDHTLRFGCLEWRDAFLQARADRDTVISYFGHKAAFPKCISYGYCAKRKKGWIVIKEINPMEEKYDVTVVPAGPEAKFTAR